MEAYAVGPPDKLSEMAALLHKGPRWADVRGVEEQEAEVQRFGGFQTE